MNHDKALDFYQKIKNEYKNDFESFFEYFEDNWLNIEDNNATSFCYYNGKLILKKVEMY